MFRPINLFLEFSRERFPQLRMRFHQTGDVTQILDAFALSPSRIAPSFDLAFEGVLQRGDPKQNAMDVGRNRPFREIAIEIFGAELKADL